MAHSAVNEATRQNFEQARLKRAVAILQVLVGVLAVAVGGLVFGLTQIEARLRENASEVHGLRESIQKALGDFEPKIDTVIAKLDVASGKADQLDASLGDASEFDARVDKAIQRANEEIPRSFEKFFEKEGGRLVAGAVARNEVQEAGRKQAAESMKRAMDDPSVEQKAEDKASKVLTRALDNAFKASTTKK
ncbi:hypothetical protein L6R50_25920 [Myxococcota bacterium]|nr:hypothetical protein [Myxococcota bacterium]